MHDLDLISVHCFVCFVPNLFNQMSRRSLDHTVYRPVQSYLRNICAKSILIKSNVYKVFQKNVLRDTGFVIARINHLHVKLLLWKKLTVLKSPMPKFGQVYPLLHKSVCLSKNLVSDFHEHWLYCHDTINEAIILSTTNIFGTIIWLGGGHLS